MIIKDYDGRDLVGTYLVDYKIDGIRCDRTEDGWVSKSGKKSLYGLNHLLDVTEPGEKYEYFTGDWYSSSSIRKHDNHCALDDLYKIYPDVDSRLAMTILPHINKYAADELLNIATSRGYEGVMFRPASKNPSDIVWKYKPSPTYDVKVLDVYEGKTGKNRGRLGGVITSMGKVSGGFSDDERIKYWEEPNRILGRVIEVKCQGLTKNGKFRHGNKVRIRWDKE